MESSVAAVVASPGRPVDPRTRGFLEPRFRHDFSRVRIHDDERAGASARAVGAQAYTVGRHVVFEPGAYHPASEDGRRLMAHEFAHVVQQAVSVSAEQAPIVKRISQAGEGAEIEAAAAAGRALRGEAPRLATTSVAGVVHRAPSGASPAASVPFYQEAIDALAVARRGIITLVRSQIVPDDVPVLEKLVALCEAIDRGAVADIKTALGAFLRASASRVVLSAPSPALVAEMVSRMVLLGMDAESAKLRRAGVDREKRIAPSMNEGFAREIYTWEDIQERLLDRIPSTGGPDALEALDGLLLFFEQVLREYFSLNEDEIKKDRKRRAEHFDNFFIQSDRTIAVYADELARMARETFAGTQSAFQLVLDQALDDLAAGRPATTLQAARDRLENRLRPLIEPANKARYVGGAAIDTTQSEFKKGGGVHRDILAKGDAAKAKRSVKVRFYDVEQEHAPEMSSDFRGVFLARRRQLALIDEIYGLQKDEKGQPTAAAKENAAAIGKLGTKGLRLHNDDDWRKFVVAKFELREAAEGREKALIAVMELIQGLMRVFTTHTPHNIDDFGDNLLTKTFPRDLAGRLIHDCGVYALRTAYILSLLRDHPKLRLRFRHTVMPLHVGLLITGDGVPTFLVNNDSITHYTSADVAALRNEWNQLDESGQKGKPAKPATEGRFSGELMADAFISGVDLPYKQADVVKTTGSPATVKAQLWRQYTRDIAPAADRLFGASVKDPTSPNYQFHLRYLKLLGLVKEHHNTSLVPFWNVTAVRLWSAHKAPITNAFKAWQQAAPDKKAAAQATYDAAVNTYTKALEAQFARVQQAMGPFVLEQVEIQTHIQAHPELFPRGTEVERAERVRAMFEAMGVKGSWWEDLIYRHMSDLRSGARVEAPFEGSDRQLIPLG